MAFQRRVVKLLTDEKCKFTHVRLADCPTTFQVGPKILTHKLSSTSVFTPDSTKVHVVKCPHPEAPPTDDDDIPPNYLPQYLYVAYESVFGGADTEVYRYPYTSLGIFGTGELLLDLSSNIRINHMHADETNNLLFTYEDEISTSNAYFRKYRLSDGTFLGQFQTNPTYELAQGFDIARDLQRIAVADVYRTPFMGEISIWDYNFNVVSTIHLQNATKCFAPHFSFSQDKVRWFHFLSVPIGADEDRYYESDVNGDNKEIIANGLIDLFGGFSDSQHRARPDDRTGVNLGFIYGLGNDALYTTNWDNPGSLSKIADYFPSTTGGNGLSINYFDKKATYAFNDSVRWVDYNGANDEQIIAPRSNNREIQSLSWGY